MKLDINPDWLIRMTEKEGTGIVSVGGLLSPIELSLGESTAPAMKPLEWSRLFPVSVMRKLKFSLPALASDADALLEFFGVKSPDAWRAKWNSYAVAFRQTQKFDFRKQAVAAWVREAEIISSRIPLADFDQSRLLALLPKLRQLTKEIVQVGLDRAQAICAEVGVALVLVPELPGTRISGCARWLNDKHAMVGLTLRYKWADQLWFTFFHELAHILLHRVRRLFVVDNAADHMRDDVIDPDMIKCEEEADQFAADVLIPPAALAEFLRIHGKTLTNDEIHDFAGSIGVGPGIVVGRLQHKGILKHWQGNKLKQKLDWGFASEE